jgi:hypothetical protein
MGLKNIAKDLEDFERGSLEIASHVGARKDALL